MTLILLFPSHLLSPGRWGYWEGLMVPPLLCSPPISQLKSPNEKLIFLNVSLCSVLKRNTPREVRAEALLGNL